MRRKDKLSPFRPICIGAYWRMFAWVFLSCLTSSTYALIWGENIYVKIIIFLSIGCLLLINKIAVMERMQEEEELNGDNKHLLSEKEFNDIFQDHRLVPDCNGHIHHYERGDLLYIHDVINVLREHKLIKENKL